MSIKKTVNPVNISMPKTFGFCIIVGGYLTRYLQSKSSETINHWPWAVTPETLIPPTCPALYTDTILIRPKDTAGLSIENYWKGPFYDLSWWLTVITNMKLSQYCTWVLLFALSNIIREGKTGSHLEICCPMVWLLGGKAGSPALVTSSVSIRGKETAQLLSIIVSSHCILYTPQ